MDFISTRKGNSIFDELKLRLHNQKISMENMAKITTKDGELEEMLDIIESDYIFSLFKLDEVAELQSRDEELQRKFIEQKLYTDNERISEKAKLQLILTTACILNRVNTRTQDLGIEEMELLASSMVPINLEDYPIYGDILSNPILLRAILNKTENLDERLDLCNQVISYCDTLSYDEMDNSEYRKACYDAVEMINEKQVKSNSKKTINILPK